jgi:hypothetical protein
MSTPQLGQNRLGSASEDWQRGHDNVVAGVEDTTT